MTDQAQQSNSQKPDAQGEADNSILEGSLPRWDSLEQLDEILVQAVDYRGDMTVKTNDGKTLVGYIFDRRNEATPPVIRMMIQDDASRVNVPYEQIESIHYSGRDTAAGKSWETWVKKYNEKKAKGETYNLEPEKLD